MKKWITFGIALVFCVGVAAASHAKASNNQAAISKIEAANAKLEKKIAVAKKAKKAAQVKALQKQLAANNAKIAKLKAMGTASMPAMPSSPKAPAAAPVAKAPSAPSPSYAAAKGQYEIVTRGVYTSTGGSGIGVIGTVSMPTILNDIAASVGLNSLGISNVGLAVGAGYLTKVNNSAGVDVTYAPLIANGILTLYSEPAYSIYAEGGLNFPVRTGVIGGQVAIGGDWAVPELGGKLLGEVGYTILRRTGSTSRGLSASVGYKFAF